MYQPAPACPNLPQPAPSAFLLTCLPVPSFPGDAGGPQACIWLSRHNLLVHSSPGSCPIFSGGGPEAGASADTVQEDGDWASAPLSQGLQASGLSPSSVSPKPRGFCGLPALTLIPALLPYFLHLISFPLS